MKTKKFILALVQIALIGIIYPYLISGGTEQVILGIAILIANIYIILKTVITKK